MKKITFSVLALAGIALIVVGFSNFQSNRVSDGGTMEFQKIKNSASDGSALLIDVRTQEEFESGHIDQSINFPLNKIEAQTYPSENKNELIYVYCRSGNRSAEAKRQLNAAGYSNVFDLGGIDDVVTIGGKIVKGEKL